MTEDNEEESAPGGYAQWHSQAVERQHVQTTMIDDGEGETDDGESYLGGYGLDDKGAKYSPDQLRDSHGRFGSGGGSTAISMEDQFQALISARDNAEKARARRMWPPDKDGMSVGPRDVEALTLELKTHPRPPVEMTVAGKQVLEMSEKLALLPRTVGKDRHEYGMIFDKDGNVLLGIKGDRNHIAGMPGDPELKFRDAIFSHSHPDIRPGIPAGTFSPSDLMTAQLYQLSEIRAVDSKSTYSLRAPASGWNISQWVGGDRDWASRVEMVGAYRFDSSPKGRAGQVEAMSKFWETYAEKTGATYTVTPHK